MVENMGSIFILNGFFGKLCGPFSFRWLLWCIAINIGIPFSLTKIMSRLYWRCKLFCIVSAIFPFIFWHVNFFHAAKLIFFIITAPLTDHSVITSIIGQNGAQVSPLLSLTAHIFTLVYSKRIAFGHLIDMVKLGGLIECVWDVTGAWVERVHSSVLLAVLPKPWWQDWVFLSLSVLTWWRYYAWWIVSTHHLVFSPLICLRKSILVSIFLVIYWYLVNSLWILLLLCWDGNINLW